MITAELVASFVVQHQSAWTFFGPVEWGSAGCRARFSLLPCSRSEKDPGSTTGSASLGTPMQTPSLSTWLAQQSDTRLCARVKAHLLLHAEVLAAAAAAGFNLDRDVTMLTVMQIRTPVESSQHGHGTYRAVRKFRLMHISFVSAKVNDGSGWGRKLGGYCRKAVVMLDTDSRYEMQQSNPMGKIDIRASHQPRLRISATSHIHHLCEIEIPMLDSMHVVSLPLLVGEKDDTVAFLVS